jgi:hypothetical protein
LLASGRSALVTLAPPRVPATTVMAHPGASLSVQQTVVPLGLTISKFGSAAPLGDTTFNITSVSADGVAQPTTPVLDDFAPGQFLALSDDDSLASPSFERLASGVEIDGSTVFGPALPGSSAINRSVAYETLIVDTVDGPVREDGGVPTPLPVTVLTSVLATGSAGRATIAHSGSRKYQGPIHSLVPEAFDFVVATIDQLTPSDVGAPAGLSYAQARAALGAELAIHPERRGSLQVIAGYEVGVSA